MFSLSEIVGLVILAIIVFGPDKLPELARKAARVIAYLRRVGNDARGQLRRELGPEYDNIHLADLNPKTFISKHLLSSDEVADLRQIRDDALTEGRLVQDTLAEASGTPAGAEGRAAGRSPVVPFDPEAT